MKFRFDAEMRDLLFWAVLVLLIALWAIKHL